MEHRSGLAERAGGLAPYASDPERLDVAPGGELIDAALLGDDPLAWGRWLAARRDLGAVVERARLDLPGAPWN